MAHTIHLHNVLLIIAFCINLVIIQSVPDETVRLKQLSCSIVTLPSMEVDAPSLCKKLVAIALIALCSR